jgi:hypothetical protein
MRFAAASLFLAPLAVGGGVVGDFLGWLAGVWHSIFG